MGRRGPQPRPAGDLRTVSVACRLTDAELGQLLSGKPKGMSNGEWLRTRALARRLPRPVPELNLEAWRVLAKVAGNLATVATAMRGGEWVEEFEVRRQIDSLRLALIGAQIEGGDEGDAEN